MSSVYQNKKRLSSGFFGFFLPALRGCGSVDFVILYAKKVYNPPYPLTYIYK